MSEARRLHRAGIAIAATEDLRQAMLPVAVAVVVSGGLDSAAEAVVRFLVFGAIGAAVSFVIGYIRWETTTYRVADGAVRFRTGILEEKVTSIPIDRIQSVDVEQGPLQRLLGVQALRLQSAGSGGAGEIKLSALSAEQVAGLRAALAGSPATTGPTTAEDAPCRRLPAGRLLAAGITSAQFGFLIPVAAAGAQVVDDIADPLLGELRDGGTPRAVGPFLLAALAVVAAAWLVAFVGTVVAFAGFTIRRVGDRLLVTRGLLVRREASVPVARVQAVRVVDGLLRQPLGLTQLRVETAGYADERADARTLFPLLRRSEVGAFLAELLPELEAPTDELDRPPARAARRYVLPPALAAGALGLGAAIALGIGSWWPLPLAVVALAAGWGALRYRAAGWSLDGARLVVRSRILARSTVIARRGSVDIRSTMQNPLQRRARLASLHFAIASKHRFGVDHLESAAAAAVLRALAPR
jgi:putative membrane protein